MVTTTATNTPPNAQANDTEKRRKHAMDRAKANHLSRQLQMRLQYARLKVDHGWQKQNLNEVENLYFHHSHTRGPRPVPTTSLFTTTQPDTFSIPPSQSSLSFKLGNSSLTRTPTLPVLGEAQTRADDPTIIDLSMDSHLHQPLLTAKGNQADRNSKPSEPHSSSPTDTLLDDKPSSETATAPAPQTHTPRNTHSKSPHLPQSWAAPPSSNSHYPNVLQRSQPQILTSTSTEAYNSSSLTYDSFWSSHLTANGSRPFRASPNNATAIPNQTTAPKANTCSTNSTFNSGANIQTGKTAVGQ